VAGTHRALTAAAAAIAAAATWRFLSGSTDECDLRSGDESAAAQRRGALRHSIIVMRILRNGVSSNVSKLHVPSVCAPTSRNSTVSGWDAVGHMQYEQSPMPPSRNMTSFHVEVVI